MLPFQAGFKKNYRTSDHIFNIFNLNKKYLKEIYINSCFVDFQNSNDSVWKENPVYKLEKVGISRNILKAIKSMYTS